jgi:hypothetical protein
MPSSGWRALEALPLVFLLAAGLAPGGCSWGNYSNDDLEFMSALPERVDVAAVIPVLSGPQPVEQAELYLSTRKAINDFNAMVDALLGLIDTIRSYPPTSRAPDARTWGPFPADRHPGWQVQMVVTRNANDARFDYHVDFQRQATALQDGTEWQPLISGWYAASGGVRKGTGHISVDTQPLRAVAFDPGVGRLVTLDVDYDTSQFPVTVSLSFTTLAVDGHPEIPTQGTYAYSAQETGGGSLVFDLLADPLPGPMGLETLHVTSQWLGTGAGRADVQLLGGDVTVEIKQTECWDQQARAVYNDKPWSVAEDVPGNPPGDAAVYCPVIPAP